MLYSPKPGGTASFPLRLLASSAMKASLIKNFLTALPIAWRINFASISPRRRANCRHGAWTQMDAFNQNGAWSRRDLLQRLPLLAGVCWPSNGYASSVFPAGLFVHVPHLSIPTQVREIRTRGWDTDEVGGARYIYDSRVDCEWVAAHPHTSVLSANGRGFRLQGERVDVRQLGAKGDGVRDDSAPINAALARGGEVLLAGPATYLVTKRLIVSVVGTKLLLGNGARLLSRGAWRYRGGQLPFGNAIHVTADNCEVAGMGASSTIELAESDANGIGFLHCAGGRVSGLVLLGGKRTIKAIKDDTFQSGISIVNARGNNLAGKTSATLVESCQLADWMQYGINIYGNLAADILVRNNNIRGCGDEGDAESAGSGIAITHGPRSVRVERNVITANKKNGVFVSAAGERIDDVSIRGNTISGNGREGIYLGEERQFGSIDALGQHSIDISQNVIERNGVAGVRAGTYQEVGSITNLVVRGNQIRRNEGPGLLLQANAGQGRGVEAVVEANELSDNAGHGIAVGYNRVTLRQQGNRFLRNRLGATVDYRSGTGHPLK